MPAKKTTQKAPQKPAQRATQKGPKKSASKLTPSYIPTKRESEAAVKRAEADMKKHGFKTVEELTAYYDSKRGY